MNRRAHHRSRGRFAGRVPVAVAEITLALAVVACEAPRVQRDVRSFLRRAELALAAGDPDAAEEVLANARRALGGHPAIRAREAAFAQMRWDDATAIEILLELAHADYPPAGEQAALRGWLGELLFGSGEYTRSAGYLAAAGGDAATSLQQAMAELAQWLPNARAEPRGVAAELPLLGEALPALRCRLGRLDRDLVLDTGATMTTVSATLAAELLVFPIVDAGRATDGLGQSFTARLGIVHDLTLGALGLGSLPVLVVDDRVLALRDAFGGAERPPSGLIGLDVLTRFRFTLDPTRRSVVLEPPRGLSADESARCLFADGQCLVEVAVDGQRMWFVLDTGASHSSLTPAGVAALPGAERRVVDSFRRVRGPGGTLHSVRSLSAAAIRVGLVEFGGVELPIVDRQRRANLPVHGVFGFDLLGRVRATFDRGRLRLQAVE